MSLHMRRTMTSNINKGISLSNKIQFKNKENMFCDPEL